MSHAAMSRDNGPIIADGLRPGDRRLFWWTFLAAAAILVWNPAILYLQSTPMTEPLLVGASFASLLAVDRWFAAPEGRTGDAAWRAGGWIAILVLSRYEGWCIASGLIIVAIAGA